MIEHAQLPAGTITSNPDSYRLDGSAIVLLRDGVEVQRIRLQQYSTPLVGVFPFGSQDELRHIFWERKVAGINCCNTAVNENQTTGAVVFNWSDGSSNELGAWADLADIADQIDADPSWLKKFLMARAYRMSPGGEDKRTQVGAQAGANLVAAEPITYTPAV